MDTNNELKFDFGFSETQNLEIIQLSKEEVSIITTSAVEDQTFDSIEHLSDKNEDINLIHNLAKPFSKTWEMKVVSISNWPEFKTKTCYKWIDIPLDGRTKVPYPCVWRRTCKKAWYLRIVYGGTVSLPDNIERIIEDCSKTALVPAVPILITGNVGGAVAVFLSAFKSCLVAKGIQEATKFSAGFVSKKTCGKWKRV